jgi:hypothetical protein
MKPHVPKALPPTIVAQFDAEEWNGLSSQERIRRCLLYAQEATELGVHARPDAQQAYADLSQQWLALAMEIEKTTGMS